MSDGSVFVRKMTRANGARYYVYARVREGGRWRQRVLSAHDRRRDAQRAAEEARRRLRAGTRFDADRLRVAEWCGTWLAAGDWRPKTRAGYEWALDRYVLPRLGDLRLRDLRRSTVEGWLRALEADGCGRATVSQAHRTLRAALAAAVRDGILEVNPATAMRVPQPGSRADAAWRPEHLSAFLAEAQAERLFPLLRFLATTGCRLGEALGLGWDRVELNEGAVVIDRTLVEVDGRLVWSAPKTGRGRRRVPLDAETVAVLRAWRRDQAAERLVAGAGWGGRWREAGLVFTNEAGGPVDPSHVRRVMRRVARRAGLPADLRVSPHALRHTAATLALSTGRPPALVAAELGHDPHVLLSTYTHAVSTDANVAEAVSRLVDGA
ncbi:MAG: tyrosine-type recombinase/integrase [Armatimonadota bacterium]|nr:tyrosine-type recombinase/integrase [Armatimonadota bacterium]